MKFLESNLEGKSRRLTICATEQWKREVFWRQFVLTLKRERWENAAIFIICRVASDFALTFPYIKNLLYPVQKSLWKKGLFTEHWKTEQILKTTSLTSLLKIVTSFRFASDSRANFVNFFVEAYGCNKNVFTNCGNVWISQKKLYEKELDYDVNIVLRF